MAIEDLIKTYKAAKRELSQQLQAVFKEEVKAFFDASPDVEAVRWDQYTPYFNDGDECCFGVHEPEFLMAGTDEFEEAGWGECSKELEAADQRWKDGPYQLWEEDEILEEMFGDHVEVVVTREGFEVSKCAHD